MEELVQTSEDRGSGKSELKDSVCLMTRRTRDIVRDRSRAVHLIDGCIHSEHSGGAMIISQ
jgi:hypothetical protein